MQDCFDFVIVGSGFGGSVAALRLAEKGYKVAVLERGRRFRDQDFAKTTWNFRRYLWAPVLGCRGILQISPFRDVFVLHGAGVGGGSLGYANVLVQPAEEAFDSPAWKRPVEWGKVLKPFYAEAQRMLGVTVNPFVGPADEALRKIAADLGQEATFHSVPVGTYFGKAGEEGVEVPDPYFGGEGPARRGCKLCGGCMVGCQHNAKNTLPKNYLYFAEARGARIVADTTVRDIRPLEGGQADGARYEIHHRGSGGWFHPSRPPLRARNVLVSAGALGTLRLLFRCRDTTGSLKALSPRLGDMVRTNNEALLGSVARNRGEVDYSKGAAITSIFNANPTTTVEPVRYPAGSGSMRLLTGPMIGSGSIPAAPRHRGLGDPAPTPGLLPHPLQARLGGSHHDPAGDAVGGQPHPDPPRPEPVHRLPQGPGVAARSRSHDPARRSRRGTPWPRPTPRPRAAWPWPASTRACSTSP